MIGVGYEKNLTNTIESLKKSGFDSKITFVAPANKGNTHWVLGCGMLNLDTGKVESETKVDSLVHGRQTDSFSCGVHTMEAAAELINDGFCNYMQLYNSKEDKSQEIFEESPILSPVSLSLMSKVSTPSVVKSSISIAKTSIPTIT